jgi:hypothetical protein
VSQFLIYEVADLSSGFRYTEAATLWRVVLPVLVSPEKSTRILPKLTGLSNGAEKEAYKATNALGYPCRLSITQSHPSRDPDEERDS